MAQACDEHPKSMSHLLGLVIQETSFAVGTGTLAAAWKVGGGPLSPCTAEKELFDTLSYTRQWLILPNRHPRH